MDDGKRVISVNSVAMGLGALGPLLSLSLGSHHEVLNVRVGCM